MSERRITVGLIPKVDAELDGLVAHLGQSKTDTVNQAISLYSFVRAELAKGNELLVRDRDGEVTRVVMHP